MGAAAFTSTTKVLPCKCEHDYQDKRYGKGLRLHNVGSGGKSAVPTYRCTVCGNKRGG